MASPQMLEFDIMIECYKEDLAYIHDVGFRDYVLNSASGIIEILQNSGIQNGLVVDLGCGSGLSAQELIKAHYDVLGIDISESMIQIARNRVPNAAFRVGSLFQVDIPPCEAVISIGECINYWFEPNLQPQTLVPFFKRIYNTLIPGGVFIFDIAEPGQVTLGSTFKNFTEGADWIVLVEKRENQEQQILTRRIITFRQIGENYRRSEEVHHLRLYQATDVAEKLHQVGFQVKILKHYGQYHLPEAHAALMACKAIN